MSAPESTDVLPALPNWVVRFVHPEKATELARLSLKAQEIEPLVAAALGLSADELAGQREHAKNQVEFSARQLLREPDVLLACSRLPFRPGQVIVALGDSITDDSLSWAHQLNAVLQELYSDNPPTLINAGRSGDTTADVIDRLDMVLALEPDWVVQLIGTNDARCHGNRQVFSARQTNANLETIRHLLVDVGGAQLIRMTPPPVAASYVQAATAASGVSLRWHQRDIARVGRHLMRSDPSVIDLHNPLLPHAEALLDPDGLHPNLVGHRAILQVLLRALGSSRPAEGSRGDKVALPTLSPRTRLHRAGQPDQTGSRPGPPSVTVSDAISGDVCHHEGAFS